MIGSYVSVNYFVDAHPPLEMWLTVNRPQYRNNYKVTELIKSSLITVTDMFFHTER